jgi:hypothetical protein
MAVLDYGSGADILDATSQLPRITIAHVNSTRRLLDISLAIRELWRTELDKLEQRAPIGEDTSLNPPALARPMCGDLSQQGFGIPDPTQAPLLDPLQDVAPASIEIRASSPWRSQFAAGVAHEEDVAEEAASATRMDPLRAIDHKVMDTEGFGPDGAMVFHRTQTGEYFNDRVFIRRLLMTGKSSMSISQLIDNNTLLVQEGSLKKRKKVRASKDDVVAVVQAAFVKYPRLGVLNPTDGGKTVVLKGWPSSEDGQILFHNELMRCCGISLLELSKKRAAFHEAQPSSAEGEPLPSRQRGPAGVPQALAGHQGLQHLGDNMLAQEIQPHASLAFAPAQAAAPQALAGHQGLQILRNIMPEEGLQPPASSAFAPTQPVTPPGGISSEV